MLASHTLFFLVNCVLLFNCFLILNNIYNLAVVYQARASIDIRAVIDLKDALREIDKKDYRDGNGTFSIVFMTCNRVKKTGGEIKVIPQAYKCGLPANCKGHEMRGILDMETGKKTAVHNRLIFQVNKHEVYWV